MTSNFLFYWTPRDFITTRRSNSQGKTINRFIVILLLYFHVWDVIEGNVYVQIKKFTNQVYTL